MTIHLSSPTKFWEALVRSVNRADLLEDERFATHLDRVRCMDELQEILAGEFRKKTRAEWLEILEANDVPHAPAYTLDEVFQDPQVRHLGLELRLRHPTQGEVGTVAPPVQFSGTPWGNLRPPPELGEHNAEILHELGMEE